MEKSGSTKRKETREKKVGLPPGALPEDVVEDQPLRIEIFDYTTGELKEKTTDDIEECFPYRETPSTTWINIVGIDVEGLKRLGDHFDLHPLVLEDILTADQRPKIEAYDDYMFAVAKMLKYNTETLEVVEEQISFVIGENTVFTFQDTVGDVFDPVRDRIRSGKGRIRTVGPDYLLYALIDTLVDTYFLILEHIGEDLEHIETALIEEPDQEELHQIHKIKRELIYVRKAIWPLREVISKMERYNYDFITDDTQPYLRDVYDHTIQIIDTVENLRDITSGLLDLYLSSISHRMNQVMKVLSVIGTIFLPLTFVAGVYGMNFDPGVSPWNMPELNWYWGYPAVLVFMAVITVGMAIYFKKKNWF